MAGREIGSVFSSYESSPDVGEERYPYLIVMLNVGVYTYAPIRFVASPRGIDNGDLDDLKIFCSEPYVNGKLTGECRRTITEEVGMHSTRTNLEMCIVFGRNDALYVAPDGKVTASEVVPSYYIRI